MTSAYSCAFDADFEIYDLTNQLVQGTQKRSCPCAVNGGFRPMSIRMW